MKPIITIGLIFLFSIDGSAQDNSLNKIAINPLLGFPFKNPVKENFNYTSYLKPRFGERFCFSLTPTLADIEASCREFERRRKQTFFGQIVSDVTNDIITNQVNSLIQGKKPVALIPKF